MVDPNKKTFNISVAFVIVYIILAIIILVVIWHPKIQNNMSGEMEYDNVTDGEKRCQDLYLSQIRFYLKEQNSDELLKKLDKSFMENNNLNESNYKEFLLKNHIIGKNPTLKEGSFSKQSDNVYVYRFKYYLNGYQRYVNVIETYPYQFTISFEQDSLPLINNSSNETTLKSTVKNNNIDNVKYEVSKTSVRDNGITYTLKITNNSDKDVEFNFDNITNVSVILSDGKIANLGAAVISSDDDILTPGGSLTKELFFAVSSQDQNKITNLRIQNVSIGDEKKTVILNI